MNEVEEFEQLLKEYEEIPLMMIELLTRLIENNSRIYELLRRREKTSQSN